MSQKASLILFLALALLVTLAALLLWRKPIDEQGWTGILPIKTTTPTMTLLPAAGWWNDLPTAWVQRPLPAGHSRPTHSPTP